MQDTRLIQSIADGDDTALRELFNQYAPWLAARLQRMLPTGAAEDVIQETFIAVWRGAASWNGQGEAGAWIWGIARRQAK
jgi:RNA polymerase sigma-70 factor (ECF subfamily)